MVGGWVRLAECRKGREPVEDVVELRKEAIAGAWVEVVTVGGVRVNVVLCQWGDDEGKGHARLR